MSRLFVGVVAVMVCLFPMFAMAGGDFTGCEWLPGHLLVNFHENVGTLEDMDGNGATVVMGIPSVDVLLEKYKVTRITRVVDDGILDKLDLPPDFYRLILIESPNDNDVLQMMADFEADPNVEYAEPDLLRRTCDRTPNDPLWTSQWDKRAMNCPRAWEFTTGSRDLIVVAIDIGTRWQHEDFYDNLWVNPGEDVDGDGQPYTDNTYPGDNDDLNGIDDDGDGKVDDFIAWDFIRNIGGCAPGEDCDSQEDNDPTSIDNHGTHTLGIMGAVGNNSIGVAGVNWNVRIMCCRAGYLSAQGQGYLPESATVPCILWASGHGANVMNMSYGGPGYSQAAAQALQTAWDNGALLCASSGNDHLSTPNYPAAYPHVISVGSVDNGDIVSDFSNYGTTVDCFAPGNPVTSTSINPSYEALSGTSMSSPNAAGVCALLWSLFPDATNQDIEDLVLDNCVDIHDINPQYGPNDLGHGRVDAMKALQSVFPYLVLGSTWVVGDNDGDGRLEPGESGGLVVTVTNEEGWTTAFNAQAEITTDDPNLTITNGMIPFGFIDPGQSVNNASSPVQITVSGAVTDAYWSVLTATLSDGGDYPREQTFVVRIGRPQTLLVADDGGDNFYSFFDSGLWDGQHGFNHDVWSNALDGELSAADIAEYNYIVWVCGNEGTNTLTPDDQTMLANFMDGGGSLFLDGQNIDEDIHGTSFYSDYLHCQTGSADGNRQLDGVAGDPISDGMSLLLVGACGGNGLVGPSQIIPINGAVGIFDYTQGGIGAIRYDAGNHKVVYFSCALEAACGLGGTTHYSDVMRSVMRWFGAYEVDVDEPRVTSPVPAGYALKANYPNPFNPSTTIAFDLPHTTKMQLRVFDVEGRLVDVLVNGPMSAGSHTITFDGSRLASGVYLAQMQADHFTATQRMVLLK